MFLFLKSGYANFVTSGSHLLLLLVAFQLGDPRVWLGCLALIAAISFVAWVSNLKRNRAVADTPTSKIGSAAQGYVEIHGRACRGSEYLATGKLGSLPCIWYRYTTYRKDSDNKWEVVARGISDSTFGVEDGSGRVLVDPDHAEVLTNHRNTWYDGDYKHVEEQLLPSDSIYVLGEFTTVGGTNGDLSLKDDVAALLAEWKKDQPSLLQRFDLNNDGQIDMHEWELARRAAQREVEKQHREIRLQPGVHVMRAPTDGRHFLIANLSPQQLNRKFVLWGWFHLLVFFGAGSAAAWMAVTQEGLW
jgi:hypothetical protein